MVSVSSLTHHPRSARAPVNEGIAVVEIHTSHHTLKTYVDTPERQSKKKTTAFELLLLSNYFWEMNDFGDAIIK